MLYIKALVKLKKKNTNKYPQKWNPKQSKQTKTQHMPFIHHQATLKPVPIINPEEGDWLPRTEHNDSLWSWLQHRSQRQTDKVGKKWRWDLLFLLKVDVIFQGSKEEQVICGKTIRVYYTNTCQTSKFFKEDSSSKVKSSHLFHFISKYLTCICTLVKKEKERWKND